MNSILKLFLASTIFAVFSLQAGLVLTFETDEGEEVNYFDSGKTAVYTNNELDTIIDAKGNWMYEINHDNAAFTKVKISEFAQEMAAIMKEQMPDTANNPMFQQMIEHQKKMAAQTKMEINKIGSKSFAGIKADGYVIKKNGDVIMEKWVSENLEKMISKEFDYAMLKEMIVEMTAVMAQFMPNDPEVAAEQEVDSKGVLVYETESSEFNFGGGSDLIRSLISVEEKSIDESIFLIPEDYEEVDYATFNELEEEEGW